jgi:hypothetical protein
MPTAQRTASAAGRNFTILSDGYQYEIVECSNGSEGIAELNDHYPISLGWMILGHAETRDGAEQVIADHRDRPRKDFE